MIKHDDRTEMNQHLDARTFFDSLPPAAPESLLHLIRWRLDSSEQRLVVLDDDPTGGQSLHGLPVLTSWDRDTLAAELERSSAFFIVTNSRALTENDACAVATAVGAALRDVVPPRLQPASSAVARGQANVGPRQRSG